MKTNSPPPEIHPSSKGVFRGKKCTEWAEIEAAEHDGEYADAFPFGLNTLKFTPEHAYWYEDYAYKKGRRRDRGHRTRLVLDLIELDKIDGKRVLDIGCGIGQYSTLFAMKGANVVGVELSQEGIKTANRMAEVNGVSDRCTFICGDFSQLHFSGEEFDIVLLHAVYHHLIKYPGVEDSIKELCKPGGKIIMADTVQGAGPIHMGRRLVKFCRHKLYKGSKQHEEQLGDVLFDVSEYERFAKGSKKHKIYMMSYFYMIKQSFLQYHTDKLPVRLFLRFVKYFDDVVLFIFPFMKKGCGEAVLYIEK